ncbi:uncharacterized protein LOC132101999 isoform X2 [Carassius carassius]|uniref:uncharacterized protein LOC132101999 isoform X2 n=1 Tax=Carassius carassius TaxID=217509 RepID=UPI0028694F31|nr:uncharacterized protein LOC132101999 isoform X2 [Carassius carassius]
MDALLTFIENVFPNPITSKLAIEGLNSLGVETIDDLQFLKEDDLGGFLRPIEARKLIAQIPNIASTLQNTANDLSAEYTSDASGSPAPGCSISPSSSSSGRRDSSCETSFYDHDWHYSFDVPWQKMPASFMEKLQNGERPSCSERRQLVRIVASEILEVSKCPAKKHVSEIARQMVIAYPKSFRDEINSQVVGSGYDSLLKQLVCRIDNFKRAKAISSPLCGTLEVSTKKRKLLYGCIHSDPQLLVGETSELQQEKKEKLLVMFQNNESDVKTIYDLMTSTYTSQRNNIQSGKETKDLLDEWPYLFQPAGMKAHFKELTGIDINNSFEESASSKFRRILEYFQFQCTERASRAGRILTKYRAGGDHVCGAVMLLLTHFKNDQDHFLVMVEDTSVPSDVCSEQLPATPCIVVCGGYYYDLATQ